ncbi:MAG: TetR/AcrR family transcriptional regulator [Deltaproteobacteria bacterium]|nr:MAG: TetR/AcrR family transcriptional regulator [Deltaproteobacteria bacterium]
MPHVRRDREVILSAARRVFRTKGCHATVDEVASEVGISGPALFKRFGTKQALMLEALRPTAPTDWLAAVRQGPDGRPIREQLVEISTELASWMDDIVPAMAILRAAGHSPEFIHAEYGLPKPTIMLRDLAGWLARAAEGDRLRVEEPVVAAMTWLGSLQVRAFMTHLAPDREPMLPTDRYAQKVCDQLLRGWALP